MTTRKSHTIAVILVIIAGLTFGLTIFTKCVSTIQSNTRQQDVIRVVDSLQWLTIYDNKEANGNTNKRVDRITDQQATVNTEILKTLNRIESKQDNQGNVLRVVLKRTKGLEDLQLLIEPTTNNQKKQ